MNFNNESKKMSSVRQTAKIARWEDENKLTRYLISELKEC